MLRNNEISPCPLTPFDSTAHQTTYVRACLFTTLTHLDLPLISIVISINFTYHLRATRKGCQDDYRINRTTSTALPFLRSGAPWHATSRLHITHCHCFASSFENPHPLLPILAEEFNWIVEMIATSKKRTQVCKVRGWEAQKKELGHVKSTLWHRRFLEPSNWLTHLSTLESLSLLGCGGAKMGLGGTTPKHPQNKWLAHTLLFFLIRLPIWPAE